MEVHWQGRCNNDGGAMTREVQRQWRCDGDEVGSAWCNGKARCGSKAIVDGGNQIHYSSSPSSILVFSPLFWIVR
ncbi:hypothetical protein GYH30_040263 [Glycine max]|nr:hypothetical protein GYH30_040263 [Glycine max]